MSGLSRVYIQAIAISFFLLILHIFSICSYAESLNWDHYCTLKLNPEEAHCHIKMDSNQNTHAICGVPIELGNLQTNRFESFKLKIKHDSGFSTGFLQDIFIGYMIDLPLGWHAQSAAAEQLEYKIKEAQSHACTVQQLNKFLQIKKHRREHNDTSGLSRGGY